MLSLAVETISQLTCHHVYAMNVANCLYHRKNAPDSVVRSVVVATIVENNMQKQRLHDRGNMVYITVKQLSKAHRTYVYEDDAYIMIDNQFVMAKDVKPNTWWDDEYITEVEH